MLNLTEPVPAAIVKPVHTITLAIYPSRAALGQVQRKSLDKSVFFDNRFHLTLSRFLHACACSARKAGLFNRRNDIPPVLINDFHFELVIHECIEKIGRADKSEFSSLRQLSRGAKRETLRQLIALISPLAGRIAEFLAFLEQQGGHGAQLAHAYRLFTETCSEMGVVDKGTINAAILKLLRGDCQYWPNCLKTAGRVIFEGIGWTGPFLEKVIKELSQRQKLLQVVVKRILPDYELEAWGAKLMNEMAGCLFAEENEGTAGGFDQTREALISLREGMAMNDPNLAASAREHVAFSYSVGTYGEVEDVARRIFWTLSAGQNRHNPEDICVIARNIGDYSDAIVDVFARFQIPYHFRRGIPLLSIPIIKAVFSLLELSAGSSRDVFCGLLRNPLINRQSKIADDGAKMAAIILKAGTENVISSEQDLTRRILSYLEANRLDRNMAAEIALAWRNARGAVACGTIAAGLRDLRERCENKFSLSDTLLALAGETGLPPAERGARLLNARAYQEFLHVLRMLTEGQALPSLTGYSASWEEDVRRFLAQMLQNITVETGESDESGVWILNPHDVGGMNFKTVIFLGMNAGVFPAIPSEDPLLSDAELEKIRTAMNQRAPLPSTALSTSKERRKKESVLFIAALAAARERLVFSCAGHSESGKNLLSSVYYDALWRLAGWPAFRGKMPDMPPDPYDEWRLQQAGIDSAIVNYWRAISDQAGHDAGENNAGHQRKPLAGESYAGIIPAPFCLTADEALQTAARQAAAYRPKPASAKSASKKCSPDAGFSSTAANIADAIYIENIRSLFMREYDAGGGDPAACNLDYRLPGGAYSGMLKPEAWNYLRDKMQKQIYDISVSRLNRLVACPYAFFLAYILGIQPVATNELEPDPRDIGTLTHEVMHLGLSIMRGNNPSANLPQQAKLLIAGYSPDFGRAWAVRDGKTWRLASRPPPADNVAIPLCPLDEKNGRIADRFMLELAGILFDWWGKGNNYKMLGSPKLLTIEKQKFLRYISNLVQAAFRETIFYRDRSCKKPFLENMARYNTLSEFVFREGGPADAVELAKPQNGTSFKCHGKIDRIDMLFDAAGKLGGLAVIDYKAKTGKSARQLAEDTLTAQDCQLPIYGLAAENYLLGAKTNVPIICQYLGYKNEFKDISAQCRRKWLELDGSPLSADDLAGLGLTSKGGRPIIAAMKSSLSVYFSLLEQGRFFCKTDKCDHCDYAACCRYRAGIDEKQGITP